MKKIIKIPIYFLVACGMFLLSNCKKVKDLKPPPLVIKACRITHYITDEDLGGNGSEFAFSYDTAFNLVQVTAFQLGGYPGVKVTIGANGVKRENGLSLVAWNYNVNIYSQNPSIANYTIIATTTIKLIESYKYDNKKRLIEIVLSDPNEQGYASKTLYTYDDHDNCTNISFINGNTGAIRSYFATKYDDHPSAYTNIPNRNFMHWVDASNPKYLFDMMSAHNILEWTHNEYNGAGQVQQTEKGSFVYDSYTTEGRPQNRTESYYINGQLKATHKDAYSYTDCN